jgi:hypothetical protein
MPRNDTSSGWVRTLPAGREIHSSIEYLCETEELTKAAVETPHDVIHSRSSLAHVSVVIPRKAQSAYW